MNALLEAAFGSGSGFIVQQDTSSQLQKPSYNSFGFFKKKRFPLKYFESGWLEMKGLDASFVHRTVCKCNNVSAFLNCNNLIVHLVVLALCDL